MDGWRESPPCWRRAHRRLRYLFLNLTLHWHLDPSMHKVVANFLFVASIMMFAEGAEAHSTVKGVGDLYAGLLHVLTGLEHVLPFIALSLLAGQRNLKAPSEAVLLFFPSALMIGAIGALWLPAPPGLAFFNIASAIFLGGLVAIAWPLPRIVFY